MLAHLLAAALPPATAAYNSTPVLVEVTYGVVAEHLPANNATGELGPIPQHVEQGHLKLKAKPGTVHRRLGLLTQRPPQELEISRGLFRKALPEMLGELSVIKAVGQTHQIVPQLGKRLQTFSLAD